MSLAQLSHIVFFVTLLRFQIKCLVHWCSLQKSVDKVVNHLLKSWIIFHLLPGSAIDIHPSLTTFLKESPRVQVHNYITVTVQLAVPLTLSPLARWISPNLLLAFHGQLPILTHLCNF